jgi:hypothetical protein
LETLRGFHRVLRTDGLLYVGVKEGRGTIWEGNGCGQRFSVLYERYGLGRLLREAGFEIIEIRRSESHAVFLNVFARKPPG